MNKNMYNNNKHNNNHKNNKRNKIMKAINFMFYKIHK